MNALLERFARLLPFPFTHPGAKAPGWLVLVPQGEQLLLAHSTGGDDEKPRVTLLAEEPVVLSDPAALKALARRYDLKRYAVSLLLGLDEYQMFVIEAPGVPKTELKAAVRWRVRELLDYHVEDATLDVLEIPQGPYAGARAGQLYVVAAHNRVIQSRINACQQADVPLTVIDIPEMASRNLANRLAEPERGVALLSFTEHGGLITVSYEGELLFARHIDITRFNLDEGGEARAGYYERIILEVQRSLDYVDRQMPFAAVARLWLAPFAEAGSLRQNLASVLYVPVEVIDLTQLFDFGHHPAWAEPEWQSRFFLPLGATLRTEAARL